MVSFQTPFPELNHIKMVSESDESNSKKRKWDDSTTDHAEDILPCKLWRNPKVPAATAPVATPKPFSDIDLHLQTPLPSEWQRCLDIQSGEIHFYNTRTQKRTLRDPRESPEESSPRDRQTHMSLDLELNLPCGSLNNNSSLTSEKTSHNYNNMMKKSTNSSFSPVTADLFMSLSTNGSGDDEAEEMVATACMRCHMLVMLCKSSPTCPNCKFMHPPYHSPPDLFKPRLSLSC